MSVEYETLTPLLLHSSAVIRPSHATQPIRGLPGRPTPLNIFAIGLRKDTDITLPHTKW